MVYIPPHRFLIGILDSAMIVLTSFGVKNNLLQNRIWSIIAINCLILCRSLTKQEIAPPSHVVERYIDLLCRFQPEAVYTFLRSNDNYRVEEALDVSAKSLQCIILSYLPDLKCTQYTAHVCTLKF